MVKLSVIQMIIPKTQLLLLLVFINEMAPLEVILMAHILTIILTALGLLLDNVMITQIHLQ